MFLFLILQSMYTIIFPFTVGPSMWGQKYPECYDPYQSPINIVKPAVRYKALPALTFDIHGNSSFKLINSGTTGQLIRTTYMP